MMIAEGIALLLDAIGVASFEPDTASGTIYIEKLPQQPDQAIGLFLTGGPASSRKHGYDMPVLNVQVRGNPNAPGAAVELAWGVYSALHALHSVTLEDGTRIIDCAGVQSGPVSIGLDENERPRYSLNFQMEVRNITAHRE